MRSNKLFVISAAPRRRLTGPIVDGAMTAFELFDEPSEVDAEDGAVCVFGPGPVKIRLTPAAAEETSERLLEAAMKARGQHYFERPDD